ncbi:MAG: phosphatase PAP2 family protein [Puia sp.]|nr:phosphatase PAP2 family protein [Puia sp.]
MTLLKWLDRIDKVLFVLIQHDSDHSVWDKVMPLLREPLVWVPLYLFLLYYSIRKAKTRAWLFIGLSILCVAATDSVSASLLKPFFARLRPCYDAELQGYMRSLVDCGGLYSMPSSHAANHVGLATFWYWSLYIITGRKWRWLWVWALAIGYAQVYVGKHYPSDVLAGSLLGYVIGIFFAKLFERGWHHPAPRKALLSVFSRRTRVSPVDPQPHEADLQDAFAP